MNKRVLAVAAMLVVMSMVLVGCGGSGGGKSSGASTAGAPASGSSDKPYYIEKPYPEITAESAGEKKAVASAQSALETYIKNAEFGNKQNNRTDQIFYNKEGYKPRFVGYDFNILSKKLADGTWKSVDVSVFGEDIKPISVWERFGSANKGDGVMNDSYYAGASLTSDPAVFTKGVTPESAGEKAAMAAVQAWAKKNLDPSLDQVLLTTYLVEWGEADQRPNMMMAVSPDGNSYNSVISWGEAK